MRLIKYLRESVSQCDKDNELSCKQIAPNEYINGITRKRLGSYAVQGNLYEVKRHIMEGIQKHGLLKMQDAAINEMLRMYYQVRKLKNKEKYLENLKRADKLVKEIFSLYK